MSVSIEQKKYQQLVKSAAEYIVSCNLASLEGMETIQERVEAKDKFGEYGVDYDTVALILDQVIVEASAQAKILQSKMFG